MIFSILLRINNNIVDFEKMFFGVFLLLLFTAINKVFNNM